MNPYLEILLQRHLAESLDRVVRDNDTSPQPGCFNINASRFLRRSYGLWKAGQPEFSTKIKKSLDQE